MRDYVILTVVGCGILWAFDAHVYSGRYTQQAWDQTKLEGYYLSHEVQRRINNAFILR